jgi:hypothetical protein
VVKSEFVGQAAGSLKAQGRSAIFYAGELVSGEADGAGKIGLRPLDGPPKLADAGADRALLGVHSSTLSRHTEMLTGFFLKESY